MAFLWRPGQGCDPQVLEQMREAFPQPRQPMGEAWFMGKTRKMYDWLYGDLDALPLLDLEGVLENIAAGTSCFGPRAEWEDWFHYLLPQLLHRCHEPSGLTGSTLLDALITAFISQYPADKAREPYTGFRAAALATLGQAMMDAICWPDGELDVCVGLSRGWYAGIASWQWWRVSGKLSASLFFCLKYLDPPEIGPWLGSVLAIRSPAFVGQMIAWLVGAYPVLTGERSQPSDLLHQGYPDISWFWSHVLTGNYTERRGKDAEFDVFIPPANRAVAIATVGAHLIGNHELDWLATISADPALEAELEDLPFDLCRLYARQ